MAFSLGFVLRMAVSVSGIDALPSSMCWYRSEPKNPIPTKIPTKCPAACDHARTNVNAKLLIALFLLVFRRVRTSANTMWCPGAESNHRHHDFQSCALPTELPGRRAGPDGLLSKARGVIEARIHTVQNACSAPGALWREAARGTGPRRQPDSIAQRRQPGRLIRCNLNASKKCLA